ncbi:trypsin-like peptidase domain-containing protein [Streptomyces sanyensis]|uniref:trypsin-like peptidase domain-containing protein n=1 Tax=Streptomyces sanyensis TaxID=568869 RepID=UPI003D77302A
MRREGTAAGAAGTEAGAEDDAVHFVDRFPFDWRHPASRELRDLLASVHFREEPVVALAQEAGIRPASIHWGRPMDAVWHELIETARRQERLRTLLERVTAGPDAALARRVGELLRSRPVVEAAAPAQDTAALTAQAPDAAERQILRTASYLDVSFLRRGVEVASSVARLLVSFADGATYHGTAFRIAEDTLLTSHHVLFDAPGRGGGRAVAAEAWFGYENDAEGRVRAHVPVRCLTDSAAGDAEEDWAVVRTAEPVPEDAAVVELPRAVPVVRGDRVYIVQHPHGGVKKLAAHHNVVRYADDSVVRYWTDTDHGSSGSPVFDRHWRPVALHQRWVRVGPQGAPPEYVNQGVRIDRIAAGLERAGWT